MSDGWSQLLGVGAAMLAMLGAGAGISALFSVVGVSAGVDPAKRRNATDAGENPLLLQVGFWLSVVLAAPTLALAVLTVTGALPLTGQPWWPVALLAVGLLNGALVAWGLGRAAIAVLTARLPETFARLRYPGLRLADGGTGAAVDGAPAWASSLSDAAQTSYLDARAAKEKAAEEAQAKEKAKEKARGAGG